MHNFYLKCLNFQLAVFNCGREDIPNPENGQVTADATTLGSVATFTCNTNFTLVGDEMRTCESSGWSGRNPSCGISVKIHFQLLIRAT